MSTLPKNYGNHQTGAPVLNGTAGALITLLDAVLINGYNSKTITITRSGTTATATCSSHGFSGDCLVTISGADQSEYNGEHYIDTIATDIFTFEVTGSPATPATGTITCLVTPAGWTKEFSGTNKAVYRAPSGNRRYLRVDDNQTMYSYVRGYYSMTDVDTGLEPFPTIAQVSATNECISKSDSIGSTARGWRICIDDKSIYFMMDTNSTSFATYVDIFFFGDFKSYNASDVYNTLIIAKTAQSTSTPNFPNSSSSYSNAASYPGYVVRKPVLYTAGAGLLGRFTQAPGAGTYLGNHPVAVPEPFTGKLYLDPIKLNSSSSQIVGELPGALCPRTSLVLWSTPSIIEGSGDFNGRKFIQFECIQNASYCRVFLDIRTPWEY